MLKSTKKKKQVEGLGALKAPLVAAFVKLRSTTARFN